eukprot:TRINITY_DN4041_c0_g1_i1.p1 TRINITY_DN4041_c0_g1~~TRINITY_DN4041_c0_g1_i1.p1  ORF type:complete len:352 (+),score=58.34 TRINITY_DN4041_c0_g1_i1:66-1121(+)
MNTGVLLALLLCLASAVLAQNNPSCTQDLTCLAKADQCLYDFESSATHCSTNSTHCCARGLLCSDSVCSINNVGANCTLDSDCKSATGESLSCASSTCSYISLVGDKCKTNSDCLYGTCSSSTNLCVGLPAGSPCSHPYNVSATSECDLGLFCNGICTSQIPIGSGCSSNTQCATGSLCLLGNCTVPYTVSEGHSCTLSEQCKWGTICTNSKCELPNLKLKSCKIDSDCDSGECSCSSFSGKSYCTDPYLDPCAWATRDSFDCQAEHNCTSQSTNDNSCFRTHCHYAVNALNNCGCDVFDDLYESCYYNSMCGVFPIWAIILILLTVLTLLLVGIMVAYVVMRRKSNYGSI